MKPLHVILLHGLCSTPDELLPIETALRGAGFDVAPLRIPGYSFEPAVQAQPVSPFQDWVDVVAAAVQTASARGQQVVLAGISAGATLALGALAALTASAPPAAAIAGVVLLSTPLRYDGWAVPWYHFLMPLALYTPLGRFWQYRERPPYGVKNPRIRRWIERELETRRVSSAGAAVIGVAHLREHDRLRRQVLARLPTLRCPRVLAMQAVEDEVASPANLRLVAAMQAGHFRQVLLPDSHHMISIDNDREQVARETLDFVRAILSQPPAPAPALALDGSASAR